MPIICLIFLFLTKDSLLFPETGIYKRLFNVQVAVSDDGSVYIIDKVENKVLYFHQDGSRSMDIGGPGQGPGKLNTPDKINILEDKLFVSDRLRIHQFSLEGQPITATKKPADFFKFQPCKGGWVGISGLFPGRPECPPN